MAIPGFDPVVGDLVKSLGLRNCRKAVLRMEAGSLVMLDTESYATREGLVGLTGELETGNYVVITREEYEKLKANERA